MELIKAEKLAIELMTLHNLIIAGWRFEFDRSVRRFGVCKYRSKTIGLSAAIVKLNDEAEVRNTILHEIAHALTPNDKGHGWEWRQKCIEIGCRPERCYSSKEVNTPQLRYQATCVCGTVYKRTKRPNLIRKQACKCQRHLPWDRKHILIFVDTHLS